MKIINITLLLLFVGLLTIFSCTPKDDETGVDASPEELIIGKWRSVIHREDGNVVSGEGYREFEFEEDGNKVLIAEFEEDGSPKGDEEETWTIDGMEIKFVDYVTHDIINITTDSMTLEYDKPSALSPSIIIRHSDDFLKQ